MDLSRLGVTDLLCDLSTVPKIYTPQSPYLQNRVKVFLLFVMKVK